ncbi:hypothetical protein [Azotosporobacter soli]|uniref:hypothetical protein n=1 Tax=Azotosporobacter soli TaxID=3055040 RepID=UPI0031FE54A8
MAIKWESREGCAVTDNGLTATTTGYLIPAVSDTSKKTGKWYFELKWNNGLAEDFIGIAAAGVTSYHDAKTVLLYRRNGVIYSGYVNETGPLVEFSTSDIMGISVDIDNNLVTFYKNGVLLGSWNQTNIKSWDGVYAYAQSGTSSSGTSVTANFEGPFVYPNPNGTPLEAPSLTAVDGDGNVALKWNSVSGATGYNVKRALTAGGPYTLIAGNVADVNYTDTSVTNGTKYYYVVTALTSGGESAASNEVSATPAKTPPLTTKSELLRVTMLDSSERIYNVTSAEAEGFVAWFKRPLNTGDSCYAISDAVEGGKEYLAFDKIISFKVWSMKK